jgi:hypothetical protein
VAGLYKQGNEPQNAENFVTPVNLLTSEEGLYKMELVSKPVSQLVS